MKVALIHDWLTGMRGGERCLEAFLKLYPDADIFTLVHVPGRTSSLIDSRVKEVSFLNGIPGIARLYRAFLPLFPFAVSSLNVKGYDLVISLSHAVAKNVRVEPGVPHVCYCFTTMRYIWDQAATYFSGIKYLLVLPLIYAFRWWDVRCAKQVTEFVAISSFISARIRRFYGRRSVVIPPPVRMGVGNDVSLSSAERERFENCPPFFLCAGALVPYKRVDVAVDACSRLGVSLWVVGKGPEMERLKKRAGPSVRFFGHVSEAFLWEAYKRCEALLFPGIEDFGIVPVECLASGRPVIAIEAGGASETVQGWSFSRDSAPVEGRYSGLFVPKHDVGSVDAFAEAIEVFRRNKTSFCRKSMVMNAQQFSYGLFFERWRVFAKQLKVDPGRVGVPVSERADLSIRGAF